MSTRWIKWWSLAAASVLAACAGRDDVAEQNDFLKNQEKAGKPSARWIYNGMLPHLEEPELTASLSGHTLRISGYLPDDWPGALPYYASETSDEGGRRVTVVYPIATGKIDPSTGKAPAGPGDYDGLLAIPFTPTTSSVSWGGFPFMKYHRGRGLAFHGPITSVKNDDGSYEWSLRRGPVSHGCNRMQGEHVVELAHLMGVDMLNSYPKVVYNEVDVRVTIIQAFDVVDGAVLDVDYPSTAGFVRPSGDDVRVFPTWSSLDYPRFVCAYDKERALDMSHCEGDDAYDATLGPYAGDAPPP
jgi:hypothetical protein